MSKESIFEYITYRICQFYQQNHIKNDLGFSKLMKLLYFISGADTENGGIFKHFKVDRFSFQWTSSDIPIIEDPKLKDRVDICIDKMIKQHPKTITCDYWYLVDMVRDLISYKHSVKYNEEYEDIDNNLMIYEPKIYI